MAVYRLEVKRISRSSGRSAVAAAAYRSAGRMRDEQSGKTHDYRRRAPGVVHTEVLAPEQAPAWATQRGRLWNEAERADTRKNSTTAREAILSLPHELDDEQRLELVRGFAMQLVKRYGVAVDMAIHRPDRQGDQRNHHAHLMFTTRRLGREGFLEKTRELDDRTTGPVEIVAMRGLWEHEQNLCLERAGQKERVNCRSNIAQGIEREPQPKLGEKFTALTRQGFRPRVVEDWQEVSRRRSLRRDQNRPEGQHRHPLEREAVSRRQSKRAREREISLMRQNMRAQAEQRRREREDRLTKAHAPGGEIERALEAAASAEALRLREQRPQPARGIPVERPPDQPPAPGPGGDLSALRAWERLRQDELRREREAREDAIDNELDPGREIPLPGSRRQPR